MKDLFSIIFLSLFIIISFNCNNNKKKSKLASFYINKGFDRPRLPLIKPYELIKTGPTEWRMELFTTDVSLSVHNVIGVNVNNGKILVHSKGGTDVRFKEYDEAWILIDSSSKKEMAFLNYNAFKDSLQKIGIPDAGFKLPDALYKSFYYKGKIEW